MKNSLQNSPKRRDTALTYQCVDSLEVELPCRVFERCEEQRDNNQPAVAADQACAGKTRTAPRNGTLYKARKRKSLSLFVSESEFNRELSRIVKGAEGIRTVIFPSTTKEIFDGAFRDTSVRSVILNEGIEKLDGY